MNRSELGPIKERILPQRNYIINKFLWTLSHINLMNWQKTSHGQFHMLMREYCEDYNETN